MAFFSLARGLCSVASKDVLGKTVPKSRRGRVGRKTYIVDLASGDKRTDYVAVSNTVIGVALLLAGGIGSLATLLSVPAVILILAAMGLAGAILSAQLPAVSSADPAG